MIGASSGFSRTGAIYWPKRPCDEAGYMISIETMFVANYHIDTKRTLVIECLAFGMWIGGMQLASAIRTIALSGKYHFTIATPGLDFKATVRVVADYKDIFDQILIITNPSNITLFTALLDEQGVKLAPGSVYFPVVGEYFTEQFREHTAQVFGHSVDSPYVVWTGYGSADTGDVGAETAPTIALRKYFNRNKQLCEKVFGTPSAPMILALSPNVYVEIIDGDIVVTKNQFIPLIRYNTRDSGGLLFKSDVTGLIPNEMAEAHVRKYPGVKEIKALAYSSSDCGIMGYQCPECGFGEYHLSSDFQKIEIVDPDTLAPLPDGQTGEIIITNLRREFQPIVRYRIGDMAQMIPGKCACGDPNPRFRLAGRAGEDFKLGGAYISIDVFEKAINAFSDKLSMNFQLILDDIGNQMTIYVDVECDKPEEHLDAAEKIKAGLEEAVPELKVGRQLHFIKEFAVRLLELGQLPRNPITGKIKKIVDKRVL